MNLPTVTVFLNDGTSYQTSVSAVASNQEILAHFVGQWFNVGNGEHDLMKLCVKATIER